MVCLGELWVASLTCVLLEHIVMDNLGELRLNVLASCTFSGWAILYCLGSSQVKLFGWVNYGYLG